jgi:uncharacterized protein (DUF1684 family)
VKLLAYFLLAAAPWQADLDKWRAAREASLRSDTGWLTVAGLFWLNEGDNRLELPPPSPPCLVVFRGGRISVTLDGRTRDLRPDSTDAIVSGPLTLVAIKRGPRYGIRLRDRNAAARRDFKGLHYFPPGEQYRITAKWVSAPRKLPVANVLGQTEPMECPGYALFRIEGREFRLYPVLEEPGAKELFYIFRDQTAARETYGAGRFLYSDLPKDGTVLLDFNKAYNPPCAFTAFATCPLPPKENRLAIRIPSGELRYGDHQ